MESISLKLTNKLLRKIKISTEGTSTIHDLGKLSLKLRVSRTGKPHGLLKQNLEKN
ncbi:integrase [Orientia tsutsugamushi]|nr:integrase [Orientia tsutsugamushi]